jgi:transposase-like protein
MYLMSSTRCGISAKQLERELGVNYKTAARMMRLIRTEAMRQDDTEPLQGEVEADEMYVAGKPREWPKRSREFYTAKAVPVIGMVERGGHVRAQVMSNLGGPAVKRFVLENAKPNSVLYTDKAGYYVGLDRPFFHHTIDHGSKVYVSGAIHTQTIEGFWATVKNGLRGVYHGVSRRHLPSYLNEYVYRYNTRDDETDPFVTLLGRVATT